MCPQRMPCISLAFRRSCQQSRTIQHGAWRCFHEHAWDIQHSGSAWHMQEGLKARHLALLAALEDMDKWLLLGEGPLFVGMLLQDRGDVI